MTDITENEDLNALLMGSISETDAFYQALGRFVLEFAEVEILVLSALWRLADVPTETARAVLSGVRIDTATKSIRRLGEAQQWPQDKMDKLDAFVLQLGEITQLRNDLLHHGATAMSPTEWRVTNSHLAHIERKIRELRVTADTLTDAIHDLQKIYAHVFRFAFEDALIGVDHDAFREAIKRPWRYKPSAQYANPSKIQESPPKQKRPRRSSRG